MLPMIQTQIDCTQRWYMLQKNPRHSISSLKSIIEQIPSGAFLPMYFHVQFWHPTGDLLKKRKGRWN